MKVKYISELKKALIETGAYEDDDNLETKQLRLKPDFKKTDFYKQGRAFEPDFILFCKQKKGEELTYQVFIKPKGNHLIANDKWKEDFLLNIRNMEQIIKIDTDKYVITGVPFYNYDNENEFKRALEEVIKNKFKIIFPTKTTKWH